MKKNNGFTLLEILLVAALAAVLAVFGISTYHKKTERSRIDKTALQMQQLLQAAAAYYSNSGSWPSRSTTDFTTNYIPFGTVPTNPWGNTYDYGEDSVSRNLFRVSTVTPSQAIAEQIAAQLPFAQIDTVQRNKVIASMGLPGQNANQGLIIKAIGSLRFSLPNVSQPISFTCPAGFTGYVSTAIQDIRSANLDWYTVIFHSYPIYRMNTINNSSGKDKQECSRNNTTYTCQIRGEYTSRFYDDERDRSYTEPLPTTGSLTVLYIGYCSPNT